MKKLSIVLPTYNEQARLDRCLLMIREYALQHQGGYAGVDLEHPEIIIVLNGCTDKSAEISDAWQSQYPDMVRVIESQKKGKGAAVRAGMLAAQGDMILFTDVDLSVGMNNLVRFISELDRHPVVIGDRDAGGRSYATFGRSMMADTWRALVRLEFGISVDTQCGFKLFSRPAAQDLFTRARIDGWAFDVEILYLAKLYHWPVSVIPVEYEHNYLSKISPFTDAVAMFHQLQQIRRNHTAGLYSGRTVAAGNNSASSGT